jgi:hypothetical protein
MIMSAADTRPNFLIIGAAKSGTSSLAKYLAGHPEIYIVPPQNRYSEPSYFAKEMPSGAQDWQEYLALFEPGKHSRIRGEKSVAYLYDPGCAKFIRDALGQEVKLVAVLRNPVDMAYSNWGHQVRIGVEPETFEAALHKEDERLHDQQCRKSLKAYYGNMVYVDRARYAVQLERYLKYFEAENLQIYLFEEFFVPGLPFYKHLLHYMGVSQDHHPDEKVRNPSGGVRSAWLRNAISDRHAWKEPLKMIIPEELRHRAAKLASRLNRTQRPLPPLNPATRKKLEAVFKPEVRRLEALMGRDLSRIWF